MNACQAEAQPKNGLALGLCAGWKLDSCEHLDGLSGAKTASLFVDFELSVGVVAYATEYLVCDELVRLNSLAMLLKECALFQVGLMSVECLESVEILASHAELLERQISCHALANQIVVGVQCQQEFFL